MYRFINAQEMHKEHPDMFDAPSKKELCALTVGKSVKVCHNDERFWVTIIAIKDNTIIGEVDNDLIRSQPFKLGDKIKFKKHHIYAIYA